MQTPSRITPLRRVGSAEDISGPVLFLASDAARFVTGQTLWVDGGVFSQANWPYGGKPHSSSSAHLFACVFCKAQVPESCCQRYAGDDKEGDREIRGQWHVSVVPAMDE